MRWQNKSENLKKKKEKLHTKNVTLKWQRQNISVVLNFPKGDTVPGSETHRLLHHDHLILHPSLPSHLLYPTPTPPSHHHHLQLQLHPIPPFFPSPLPLSCAVSSSAHPFLRSSYLRHTRRRRRCSPRCRSYSSCTRRRVRSRFNVW